MEAPRYGDPQALRRRGGQLREQAVDLRSLAEHLAAHTDALVWRGRAADALRARIAERSAQLRAAAGQHETGAEALDRHARAVADLQDAVRVMERRCAELTAQATTRVTRARDTGAEPSPDDAALVAFTPPPPGHRDWLTVELPGL